MHKGWRLRLLCVALGFASLGATPASASFVHYYYDAQGRLLGSTSTAVPQRLALTDAADNPRTLLVVPLYPPTQVNVINAGQGLVADQSLVSADGRFQFVLQEDANLVVYEGSTVLWTSGTNGHQPGYFQYGTDGNLYLYGPDGVILWRTSISGANTTNAELVMQTDGNLVLYENGTAVWYTSTGGH